MAVLKFLLANWVLVIIILLLILFLRRKRRGEGGAFISGFKEGFRRHQDQKSDFRDLADEERQVLRIIKKFYDERRKDLNDPSAISDHERQSILVGELRGVGFDFEMKGGK